MSEPRTYVLELPPRLKTLSLNGRLHWAEQRSRAAELRKAGWAAARQQRIPLLARAAIRVEYQPPDLRRRDHDNICAASGKHCIDGIVDAGVLADDCPPNVTGISYALGDRYPGGRFVLTITEVVEDAAQESE